MGKSTQPVTTQEDNLNLISSKKSIQLVANSLASKRLKFQEAILSPIKSFFTGDINDDKAIG